MKKLIFLVLVAVIGYSLYVTWQGWQQDKQKSQTQVSTVTVGSTSFSIEIADDDNERAQGLSGRVSLAQNSGMLFLFDKPDAYAFWMKGMRIPLDFIWIEGTTVVDLSENVPAPLTDTYTPSFKPRVPVDKVLEVNAGEIKKSNIKLGDKVILTLIKEDASKP